MAIEKAPRQLAGFNSSSIATLISGEGLILPGTPQIQYILRTYGGAFPPPRLRLGSRPGFLKSYIAPCGALLDRVGKELALD